MSEPTTGLPVPSGQPTGIAPVPGQPPVAAPNPAPTQPAATPPAAPANTPAPNAPDPAKLQRDLEEAQRYNRALQSQKDQAEARLRAMAGIPPVVDPMEAKIKQYSQQLDLHPDDARKFLSMLQAENAPLQQHLQQQAMQIQGSSVAQQAMQAAVAANPELFSDQGIANAVWNAMQDTAQRGNLQALTPEYAKFLGAQEWAMKNEPWKQQASAPPPPAPLPGYVPRIAMGFGGPGQQSNGLPAAPAQQQDPNISTLADQMSMHLTGKTLSQRTQQ